MEDYQFAGKFDLILMRWCTGYLRPVKLRRFLQKAGKALHLYGSREHEGISGRCSLLIVLENVDENP